MCTLNYYIQYAYINMLSYNIQYCMIKETFLEKKHEKKNYNRSNTVRKKHAFLVEIFINEICNDTPTHRQTVACTDTG